MKKVVLVLLFMILPCFGRWGTLKHGEFCRWVDSRGRSDKCGSGATAAARPDRRWSKSAGLVRTSFRAVVSLVVSGIKEDEFLATEQFGHAFLDRE